MINVFYQKKKTYSNYKYMLEIKGHANYAQTGHDIVCAGVSALVQTYIAYTNRKPQVFGNGAFFMRFESEQEDVCLDMLVCGLINISKAYPNNVTVVTF